MEQLQQLTPLAAEPWEEDYQYARDVVNIYTYAYIHT